VLLTARAVWVIVLGKRVWVREMSIVGLGLWAKRLGACGLDFAIASVVAAAAVIATIIVQVTVADSRC